MKSGSTELLNGTTIFFLLLVFFQVISSVLIELLHAIPGTPHSILTDDWKDYILMPFFVTVLFAISHSITNNISTSGKLTSFIYGLLVAFLLTQALVFPNKSALEDWDYIMLGLTLCLNSILGYLHILTSNLFEPRSSSYVAYWISLYSVLVIMASFYLYGVSAITQRALMLLKKKN